MDITKEDEAAQQNVEQLRDDISRADPDTLRLLLTDARTHYGWQDRDVDDATLKAIYDIAKMGPTSMNQQPARFVFVRSQDEKARLAECAMEANRPKIMAAPVTAIIAYDTEFYEKLPEIFPPNPNAADMFRNNEAMAEDNAFRNGTLQGAWFIMAARALGLDTGPMSGFNPDAVSKGFLDGKNWTPNFLCNIGYGDVAKLFRRLPRLAFDEVATIV